MLGHFGDEIAHFFVMASLSLRQHFLRALYHSHPPHTQHYFPHVVPLSLCPFIQMKPNVTHFVCTRQGGFIFPLFFAGSSLGRALLSVTDISLPSSLVQASPTLLCMCFAAGLNVSVTRTPLATPLILTTISGQPNVAVPTLCASLAALFISSSAIFIEKQRDRGGSRYFAGLSPLEAPLLKVEEIGQMANKEGTFFLGGAAPTGKYSATVVSVKEANLLCTYIK